MAVEADKSFEQSTGAKALVALTTLGRDAPSDKVDELVASIMQSSLYEVLPACVAYVRNHAKSMITRGNGLTHGLGEVAVGRKLTLALYKADPAMGKKFLLLLPRFGSWKDLPQLLMLAEKDPSLSEQDKSELVQTVADIFVDQLQADLAALESDQPEKRTLSQAAKYAPHEHRNRSNPSSLVKCLAKTVARQLFPDSPHPNIPYRKMRVRLLNANTFIIEKYLAEGRAGEANARKITAGPLLQKRKALLNLKLKGKGERKDDEGRRLLALRVKKLLQTKSMPAPSDMQTLVEALKDISPESDQVEVRLIETSYLSAVKQVVDGVNAKKDTLKDLVALLDNDEESKQALLAAAQLPDLLFVLDCSTSQTPTLPMAALATMVCEDAMQQLGAIDAEVERFPILAVCHGTTKLLPVPGSELGSIKERLDQLLSALNKFRATSSPDNLTAVSSFSIPVDRLMQADVAAKSLVIVSDFCSTQDEVLDVLQNETNRTVLLYRMTASQVKKRYRAVNWDPNDPLISVVFVLDTTGSMGTQIREAQTQLLQMLDKIKTSLNVPVQVAFVSYKDFGDGSHPQVFEWVSMEEERKLEEMQQFIGRLRASGGGDTPEDVAEGFERASKLFQACKKPCIKIVYHVADAPAHGFLSGCGDDHKVYRSVDQAKRFIEIVRKLFGQQKAEYVFVDCGGTLNDKMVDAVSTELAKFGTFVDRVNLRKASGSFGETLQSCVSSLLTEAVVGADKEGVDVLNGTDFAVPLNLLAYRLSEAVEQHADLLEKAQSEDEVESSHDSEDEVESSHDSEEIARPEAKEKKPRKTVLEKLLSKLHSPCFDVVYLTQASLTEGRFKDFDKGPTLTEACALQIIKSGVSLQAMTAAGYPSGIVDKVRTLVLKQMMT